jgi:hypothetical protein
MNQGLSEEDEGLSILISQTTSPSNPTATHRRNTMTTPQTRTELVAEIQRLEEQQRSQQEQQQQDAKSKKSN